MYLLRSKQLMKLVLVSYPFFCLQTRNVKLTQNLKIKTEIYWPIMICFTSMWYVLQVSGLTNWLLTSPTIILINLQVIVICCQCSTISIILLTNIGISIIQISFIPSSDHCWFCSGRCIQERSRSIASYLIYPNPNSVSVQIIFNEINALFLQLNQNGTSDCHFICRFYA